MAFSLQFILIGIFSCVIQILQIYASILDIDAVPVVLRSIAETSAVKETNSYDSKTRIYMFNEQDAAVLPENAFAPMLWAKDPATITPVESAHDLDIAPISDPQTVEIPSSKDNDALGPNLHQTMLMSVDDLHSDDAAKPEVPEIYTTFTMNKSPQIPFVPFFDDPLYKIANPDDDAVVLSDSPTDPIKTSAISIPIASETLGSNPIMWTFTGGVPSKPDASDGKIKAITSYDIPANVPMLPIAYDFVGEEALPNSSILGSDGPKLENVPDSTENPIPQYHETSKNCTSHCKSSNSTIVKECPTSCDHGPCTNIFVLNPKNPCSFYQCAGGLAYPFHCPAPLYFDPVLMVCNWKPCTDPPIVCPESQASECSGK